MNSRLVPSDRAALDRLVDRLDYPMLIVTAEADGERAGCLVGFATQCSIEPPRFLLCISRQNHTFRVASRASTLVAHLLGPEDGALAALFGEETGDTVDKFARCCWAPGPGGPVLEDCRRWFAGRVLNRIEAGDHVAFLVEPFAAAAGPDDGQLGFQDVRHLRPGHPS
jgi:flavin reductase (DIM6/NTAB) family NADH-FMN oxidoreductase RutF